MNNYFYSRIEEFSKSLKIMTAWTKLINRLIYKQLFFIPKIEIFSKSIKTIATMNKINEFISVQVTIQRVFFGIENNPTMITIHIKYNKK